MAQLSSELATAFRIGKEIQKAFHSIRSYERTYQGILMLYSPRVSDVSH